MTGPWGAPTPPPAPAQKAPRLGTILWLGAIGLGIGLVVALNKLFPGNISDGDTPRTVEVTATRDGGDPVRFDARVRIDTPGEADYYRNGGILPFVLRSLAGV